jgi:hypothetical protein
MRRELIFILFVICTSCRTAKSQDHDGLSRQFEYYFSVLDSIAEGTKLQNELTVKQSAFLYLINGWTGSNTKYNHYEGLSFDSENIADWRRWYLKHVKSIKIEDFQEAMDSYEEYFKNGTIEERKLNFLSELEKKYSSL